MPVVSLKVVIPSYPVSSSRSVLNMLLLLDSFVPFIRLFPGDKPLTLLALFQSFRLVFSSSLT